MFSQCIGRELFPVPGRPEKLMNFIFFTPQDGEINISCSEFKTTRNIQIPVLYR
jgi:hypothetical protein